MFQIKSLHYKSNHQTGWDGDLNANRDRDLSITVKQSWAMEPVITELWEGNDQVSLMTITNTETTYNKT